MLIENVTDLRNVGEQVACLLLEHHFKTVLAGRDFEVLAYSDQKKVVAELQSVADDLFGAKKVEVLTYDDSVVFNMHHFQADGFRHVKTIGSKLGSHNGQAVRSSFDTFSFGSRSSRETLSGPGVEVEGVAGGLNIIEKP